MNIIFRCDPSLFDLLPRPVPARAMLPDWLRAMAPRVPSTVHQRNIRTVKQCPPFVDAMTHGFMVLLPCDVTVKAGQFSWDWPLPALAMPGHPRAPLSFHVPEQIAGSPLAHGRQSAIKFNSFWTIELEAGWSLMAVHPVHRDDLPFRLVTGLVDADRFHDVGINFPAVWVDPSFEGILPRGTPVAQCYPVVREPLSLTCAPMSPAEVKDYEAVATKIMAGPGVYRKGYRRRGIG
ncbi:hypothetical protein [Variovorax sp. dw_308]|uniref:hypothetical protein n=1 Tax=Variovorax sp. dw_308 TaxID=2721546 RepID=UPI001C4372CE|nr:hypothetical protein [Variovorax sp. dw_308]